MPKRIKSKLAGANLYRDHQHFMESAAIAKLGIQPHHSSPSSSSLQTPPGSNGGVAGGSGKHSSSTGSSSDASGPNPHHSLHHHGHGHAHHHQHHLHHNLVASHQARQRGQTGVGSSVGANQKSSNGYMNVDDQSSGLTTTTMTNTMTNMGHSPATTSGASGTGIGAGTGSNCGGRFLLGVLFTIAELLLFSCLIIWLYWSYQHDDGLAWNTDRKQQFNLHATLMLTGFVFLNGQAMLVYRSFQCCNKIYTKILHTILFVLSTSAISLGLILAYSAQENVGIGNKPIMHFYSLHAWTGLVTVSLFVLQFVFGFTSFLILLCCDRATSRYRAALLPIHRTFGLIIFSLAVSTCLTGLLQTARSRLSSKLGKIDYHELSEAGLLINALGVCLIGLAILIPYIIRNSSNKRMKSDRLRLSQLDMRI